MLGVFGIGDRASFADVATRVFLLFDSIFSDASLTSELEIVSLPSALQGMELKKSTLIKKTDNN